MMTRRSSRPRRRAQVASKANHIHPIHVVGSADDDRDDDDDAN